MPPAAATPGTVLVTGGAGYIGSHAVLALRDAGRRVAVVDTLATGFRWAVPDDVPFYHGDVADGALIDRIVAEQGVTAIMHFAGSLLVPESVTQAARLLPQQRRRQPQPDRSRRCGTASAHFIFSSTAAVYGTPEVVPVPEDARKAPINPYGNSKLMTEMMLADVARRAPAELRHPALFQRRRGRPAGAQRPVGPERDPPDPRRRRSRARPARRGHGLRHRLRHARRHRGARLYPRLRPRRRARRRARRGSRRIRANRSPPTAATAAASRCSRCSTRSTG